MPLSYAPQIDSLRGPGLPVNAVAIDALIRRFVDEHYRAFPKAELVETTPDRFSYLFDIVEQRLVAAWGMSAGKHTGARPASRMKGHPKGGGAGTHRGHAIPHTLGGGTDINLAPQLGRINSGVFQRLEQAAVARPGAFYFTHGIYPAVKTQRALWVEQGLLIPGQPMQGERHPN